MTVASEKNEQVSFGKTSGKRKKRAVLIKMIAGLTVVSLTPFLAMAADSNTKPFTASAYETLEKTARDKYQHKTDAGYLQMNESPLLLYTKPLPIQRPDDKEQRPEAEPETETEPEQNLILTRNLTPASEDLRQFDNQSGLIVETTYPPNHGTDYINLTKAGQVRNATAVDTSVLTAEAGKPPEFSIAGDGSPEVLIVHTHTSEGYQPDGRDFFDKDYTARTLDPSQSVVAVGEKIAIGIAAAGIGVIHDCTVHDYPEYSGAYARSEKTVRDILAQYPTIKVVLDIHRDAIVGEDGDLVAPVAAVNGKSASQIMIVSAADNGYYDVPEYMQNFRLASLLQQQIESDSPGLTRPVLFEYCQYNEQITTGSLLIEIGAHGSHLSEALYAGELLGKSVGAALMTIQN